MCAAAKQCHSVFVNVMCERYVVLNSLDVCFLNGPADRIKHDYDKDYECFSFLLFLMDLRVKISHDWIYNSIKNVDISNARNCESSALCCHSIFVSFSSFRHLCL